MMSWNHMAQVVCEREDFGGTKGSWLHKRSFFMPTELSLSSFSLSLSLSLLENVCGMGHVAVC